MMIRNPLGVSMPQGKQTVAGAVSLAIATLIGATGAHAQSAADGTRNALYGTGWWR